jgi:ankyrin repeat protein
MQIGNTPAHIASKNGHTETVALLLANKADINSANKVYQFKIFKYLSVIHNEIEYLNVAIFILSRIVAHENINLYLTWFMLVLYAERYYASVYCFPRWTH